MRRVPQSIAIASFVILLLSCRDPSNTQTEASAPTLPPDQQAFLSVKTGVEGDFDSAPNDIIKSQVKQQWEKTVCSVLKNANFSDWSGHIKGILGNGGFIVSIGDNVDIEESVEQSSPVFNQIGTMSEGMSVFVSGNFVKGDDDCALKLMGLPWGDSRLKTPDFDVHFTNVEPA